VGLQLHDILDRLHVTGSLIADAAYVAAAVIVLRIVWVPVFTYVPRLLFRRVRERDPYPPWQAPAMIAWAGFRGAVSLAAALALPTALPNRDLIVFLTFAVILVTLVGQGLTLPRVLRWAAWDGIEVDGDEGVRARNVAYEAGLEEVARAREAWPDHLPLIDRLESSLRDRTQHLATADADETEERRKERLEHEEIQRGVIAAQRTAIIQLRDNGEINDQTLRAIERELDFEEIRMEA
jgi:CPA1 family monovalent cation:H+ antiporter